MNEGNVVVLRKILYAVESGGQIYGCQNYAAFAGVGANTPNEKAITIGAGQWYATQAKQLLQKIQRATPKEFKRLDTAGIESDLLKKNWSTYGVSAGSAKGKCIIAIISSAVGIKCQDELMEEQIREYADIITGLYGEMPDTAMMECINIRHQGGTAALKRILAKTDKPYTAERIYAALCTDPADKSNNNQVGDYTTRQKKVIEMIQKYAEEEEKTEMTKEQIMEKVIDDAVDFAVRMAKDNKHGYSQRVRSLYNITNPTSFDCSSLVCTAYYYAFLKNGLKKQAEYLKAHCSYTGNMLNMLNCGFEVVARNQTAHAQMVKGDLELNTTHHVAMAVDKNTIVHARSSEGTSDTKDNSGNEIRTQPWYLYSRGWTHRLRFTGKGVDFANAKPDTGSSSGTTVKWKATGTATATVDNLFVRAEPNGEVIGEIMKGNRFEIDGCISGKWSHVKVAGIGIGWVWTAYTQKDGVQATEPPKQQITNKQDKTQRLFVGRVTASVLNVRTWAGTEFPKIKSYPQIVKGNLVDVMNFTQKARDGASWYYIRIAGKYYGFVSAKYIQRQ